MQKKPRPTIEIRYRAGKPFLHVGRSRIPIRELGKKDKKGRKDYKDALFVLDDHKVPKDPLMKVPVSEWPDGLYVVSDYKCKTYKPLSFIVACRVGGGVNLQLVLWFTYQSWKEDVSLVKFFERYVSAIGEKAGLTCEGEQDEEFFAIDIQLTSDASLSVDEAIEEQAKILKRIHQETIDDWKFDTGFVAKFNFPAHLRFVFLEYLAYFGQFLEDLGIESDVSIEGNQQLTTLAVKPKSKDQALDRIYIALASYLALPMDGHIVRRYTGNVESQLRHERLVLVTKHLHSQIQYATQIDRMQLQAAVGAAPILFPHTDSIADSLSEVEQGVEATWEPIKGIKFSKFKGKFFEIDVPRLGRRAQDFFTKLKQNIRMRRLDKTKRR